MKYAGVFDYFGILVSIILGLALTHLLRDIARQLVHRGAVRTYWVHQLRTFNVILNVMAGCGLLTSLARIVGHKQ